VPLYAPLAKNFFLRDAFCSSRYLRTIHLYQLNALGKRKLHAYEANLQGTKAGKSAVPWRLASRTYWARCFVRGEGGNSATLAAFLGSLPSQPARGLNATTSLNCLQSDKFSPLRQKASIWSVKKIQVCVAED
jgi:hypothetical protein